MSGIDVLPTEEQLSLVASVGRVLDDLFPIDRLKHGASSAVLSASEWGNVAELGWIGLGLPESVGGVGYDLTEAVLAHRIIARKLVTPAITATVIAAKLAVELGDGELAGRLCAGEVRAAFATRCHAADSGEHYVVDHTPGAVVVLLGSKGARFATLDCTSVRPVECIDETIELSRARFLPEISHAGAVAGLWAQALLASELCGLAVETLERAVAYAKIRLQFGKPIGAFQAISHMCASSGVRAEAASSLTNFAAIAIRDGHPDAAFQATAACMVAGDAAFENATTNIQVHGAMGFAVESDLHLFLKRAVLLRMLTRAAGGDPVGAAA